MPLHCMSSEWCQAVTAEREEGKGKRRGGKRREETGGRKGEKRRKRKGTLKEARGGVKRRKGGDLGGRGTSLLVRGHGTQKGSVPGSG